MSTKAWRITDGEGFSWFYHGENEGEVRAQYEKEYRCASEDHEITRMECLDDLDSDDALIQLFTGAIGYVECCNCDASIGPVAHWHESGEGLRNFTPWSENGRAHYEGGLLYCSRECAGLWDE